MGQLNKEVQRYKVKYLLFTYWKNFNAFLVGSSLPYVMPTLNQGSWNNVYFTPGKITLSETAENSENGPFFNYELQSFLPGNFSDLSLALSRYLGRKHLVLLELENGQRLMLGNKDAGAVFNYSQSVSALGANLSWSFTDYKPINKVEWLPQFKITAQGMLQQLYGDNNTYSLNAAGAFSVVGPDSPNMYIEASKLLQE